MKSKFGSHGTSNTTRALYTAYKDEHKTRASRSQGSQVGPGRGAGIAPGPFLVLLYSTTDVTLGFAHTEVDDRHPSVIRCVEHSSGETHMPLLGLASAASVGLNAQDPSDNVP
jgi:hypothetical protein